MVTRTKVDDVDQALTFFNVRMTALVTKRRMMRRVNGERKVPVSRRLKTSTPPLATHLGAPNLHLRRHEGQPTHREPLVMVPKDAVLVAGL